MSSRLRKVFLVNAKTSGSTTSARISEIDPRGGAAITGGNGAGKTTTLQVIALFFGYSPVQMVQSGENRESMLRFILPHPESAIVFEYQRGNEPQDVCHVILRRESNSDVGEYRFVHGPMRVDLLVANDSDGQSVFLDDEGTKDAALRLGLADGFGAKLKLAAYRSVILNVPSTGRDDLHRRQLAQRFSFSSQRLTNLDRLVAAIVKEHISFTDFADVAAQIVMDQLGVSGAKATGNKNLQLRQSKQQIEQWLRDRDAVDRAIKMEPEINQMRDVAGQFRTLEMQLGAKRADCVKLTKLNQNELDAATAEKSDLGDERQLVKEQFNFRKKALEEALEKARSTARDAEEHHGRLLNKRNFLREQDAQEWAKKWLELDALRGRKATMETVIQALESVAADVVKDHEGKLEDVARETRRREAEMRSGLEKIGDLETSEVKTLEAQEHDTIARMEEQWAAVEAHATEHFANCMDLAAQAKANLGRPMIDPDLQRRLDDARNTHTEHQSRLLLAGRDTAKAHQALNTADQRWQQSERVFNSQKEQHAKAQAKVEHIQSQLKPPAGSLHAALLASPDEDWKRTLAKVIAPQLLLRADLQPHKVTDEALLYGWGLNLESIERPEWVEQEDVRQRLAAAERELQAAANGLDGARSTFRDAEGSRQQAQDALSIAQAQENVEQAISDEIAQQLKSVEEAAATSLERIKKEAWAQAEIANRNLEEAKQANENAKKRTRDERNALRLEFSDQKQQARQRGQRQRQELHERIGTFKQQQQEQAAVIRKARDDELNAKGVDTKKLTESKNELQSIADQIRLIEDHAALVREWQEWLQQQGPIRLIDAEVAMSHANEQRELRKSELEAAENEFRQLNAAFSSQEGKFNTRIQTANDQLAILRGLATELEDFASSGVFTKTINDLASSLKAEVRSLMGEYATARHSLRAKLERVERSLTEGESSTKDFVLGVLQEVAKEAKDLERASSISRVYDRIKPEVLVNVNTSLRTMLENIATYRKTIWDFESEVRKFNNKLQEGLSKVSKRFTRFTDFKVSVVTDFDKIDFIGKLKVLDDAINDHRGRNVVTYAVETPPATTAHALRAFMTALDKGNLELNLGDHITLSGSVVDDGVFKPFHNATELEKISSNGLTAIALISLLSGLINVIRGGSAIYIPWATDEVGRFDGPNFQALMEMMAENRIDPVTASPALTPAAYGFFKHRYIFKPGGVIAEYRPRTTAQPMAEGVL